MGPSLPTHPTRSGRANGAADGNRTAIDVRVPTDARAKEDRLSIPDQTAACLRFAAERRLGVVAPAFAESRTGGGPAPPPSGGSRRPSTSARGTCRATGGTVPR